MQDERKPLKQVTHSPMERPLNNLAPGSIDPQGSYTGRPAEPFEIPVQDADDL